MLPTILAAALRSNTNMPVCLDGCNTCVGSSMLPQFPFGSYMLAKVLALSWTVHPAITGLLTLFDCLVWPGQASSHGLVVAIQ
jgi:predicted benzoate:H+ symporter BenE